MSTRVVYGIATKTVEEASQCILLDAPDGMEPEEAFLAGLGVRQDIVGVHDALKTYDALLDSFGVDAMTRARIWDAAAVVL